MAGWGFQIDKFVLYTKGRMVIMKMKNQEIPSLSLE